MVTDTQMEKAINEGNIAQCLQLIDLLCEQEQWDLLLLLIRRCRIASIERGKPLWGCAAHGEYRIALDAPVEYLDQVMDTDLGPFALGPVPEVAASCHDFSEVLPILPRQLSPQWQMFLYECVARGDEVHAPLVETVGPELVDRICSDNLMPLELLDFEPQYAEPKFMIDDVVVQPPLLEFVANVEQPISRDCDDAHDDERSELHDPDVDEALHAIAATWVTQSNGKFISAISTSAIDAVQRAADCGQSAPQIVEVSASSALARIAWAASDGGAHAKRRGMAHGRSCVHRLIAAMAGIEGVASAAELSQAFAELKFFSWDLKPTDGRSTADGWSLAIAVFDPVDEIACAVHLTDKRDDNDGNPDADDELDAVQIG